MKKNMIVGMAMAMGILTVGALSASAADSSAQCADKQVIQQYNDETNGLTSSLKAKEIELKDLLYTDAQYDILKANKIENEVKELKGKISAATQKYGIPKCCLS